MSKQDSINNMAEMLDMIHQVALARIPPQEFLDAGDVMYPTDISPIQEKAALLKIAKVNIINLEAMANVQQLDEEATIVLAWMKELAAILSDTKLITLTTPHTLH